VNPDPDLLRRSMDAAPADWLDRWVTERVVTRVQTELNPQRTRATARVRRARSTGAGSRWAWLPRLVSAGVQLLLWRGGGQRG
jgi:hypothetical protein